MTKGIYTMPFFKFSGKERDPESGLDYFGARYFSGPQGRFTSPDPLLNSGRPDDPQSWNRYTYAGNNPLRFIDPTGLYKFAVTCGEDDTACKDQQERFRQGLQQLRTAANALDKNSAERKALESALKKIGEKEGKGATIAFGDAGESNGRPNLGYANPFTNTITFNLNALDAYTSKYANIADPANPRAFTADEAKGFFTGIIGHEGGHLAGTIPLLGSIGIRNYFQSREGHALYTESTAYQGMGMNDPQGLLWNNSWLTVDRHQLENNRKMGIEQLLRKEAQK